MTPARAQQTDFDTVADEYDESLPAHVVEHYLRKRTKFILERVPRARALDVGCGTGVLAARLADQQYEMTGLDPSRKMLERLRMLRPDVESVVGDGTSLPFPDGRFDLTYCVAVMHHVAEPEAVRKTLMEMARVTRSGGHVLIWDHNPANPYWKSLMARVPQDTGAERLIPAGEVIAGLEAGGAKVVEMRQLGLVPDFVPPFLLGLAAAGEKIAEATPGLRRFCAHNVVLAVKR
jgi:ubiquinone/menaquinone biosynthesis C-methylase UbiE